MRRLSVTILLMLLPVSAMGAVTRYQIQADTTTIMAGDLLQVLGKADLDSAIIDTLFGMKLFLGTRPVTIFPTFSLGMSAGFQARLPYLDVDTLAGAVRLSGAATLAGGATVPAGQTVTGSAGSIFDLTAVTPDSILGNVKVTGTPVFSSGFSALLVNINSGTIDGATIGGVTAGAGTFTALTASGVLSANDTLDISTAAKWQLANVSYTGTMANLNTLRDDSMADALHRHSELSASDGTPNPALQVNAVGSVGIGVAPNATWGRGALEINDEAISYVANLNGGVALTENYYFNGSNNIYGEDGFVSSIALSGGAIYLGTGPSGTAGQTATATTRTMVTNVGQLLVGTETASANAAGPSLLIAQGANDDDALELTSSDVDQAVTDLLIATGYGQLGKVSATAGGLQIRGFNDEAATLGANALSLVGVSEDILIDSTDTATSTGVIHVTALQSSGTGTAALSAAENSVVFSNASTTIMLLKGGGVLHLTNATPVALDEWDDRHLVRALERQRSAGVLMSKWDDLVKEGAPELIAAGVLSSDGSMLKVQPMLSLLGGASWQNTTDIYDMQDWRDTDVEPRLTDLERRLNDVQMQLAWRHLMDTVEGM